MPYPRAAKYGNKKAGAPANTPPRRTTVDDIPLGNGLAGQAKKAMKTRKQRIDELIEAGGG